jgi:Coenzyme PQQ synthesis protein D (PqqD)
MAWKRRTEVRRADAVLEATIDDAVVVMQPANGEYAGLAGTAVRIWELIDQPTTLGEVIDTLAAEYGVLRSECAPDIVQSLEGLRRKGLVETADAAPPKG